MTQEKHKSRIGKQLYTLLPAVYRNRDKDRHLKEYLDACGSLLDRIHRTLEQRLADSFPGKSSQGEASQEWILPYLAELLDARLLSPHEEGRRDEVAKAISWRQGKGTVGTLESIVESVARTEVELQEGFRRVAVTPRLDVPLLSALAFGADEEPDKTIPSCAARHPGLPAATVDFRYASRTVQAGPENPAARAWTFVNRKLHWRKTEPFGVPCFPGSYEDASRRTVDVRTPDWKHGHHHPNRLLLFAPPPTGFFPQSQITLDWDERAITEHAAFIREKEEGGVYRLNNPSQGEGAEGHPVTVMIKRDQPTIQYPKVGLYHFENLNFIPTIVVTKGRLVLRGVAATKVCVSSSAGDTPMLEAVDCLFDEIKVVGGQVQLEYCTVMKSIDCGRLQASDCILPNEVVVTGNDAEAPSCIRYSRIPPDLQCTIDGPILCHETTTEVPLFQDFEFCKADGNKKESVEFGDPGYGVLHPATPESICFGAEDGGEMGAYHSRRYCLQVRAALEKLGGFMPLGIEAVWIPDARLLVEPPRPLFWIENITPNSATEGDGALTLTVEGAGFVPDDDA